MDADQRSASICIELRQTDLLLQKVNYERFLMYKNLLNSETDDEWTWESEIIDEHGMVISRICRNLPNVNIFNERDWPLIISFLKQLLIGLDAFWIKVRPAFE